MDPARAHRLLCWAGVRFGRGVDTDRPAARTACAQEAADAGAEATALLSDAVRLALAVHAAAAGGAAAGREVFAADDEELAALAEAAARQRANDTVPPPTPPPTPHPTPHPTPASLSPRTFARLLGGRQASGGAGARAGAPLAPGCGQAGKRASAAGAPPPPQPPPPPPPPPRALPPMF